MSYRFELYRINSEIEACFDPETGELDDSRFYGLCMEREDKLEQLALMIKNLRADAAALKAEKAALGERQKAAEDEADKIAGLLKRELCGEPMKTAKVNITWKSTQKVDVLDMSAVPEEFIRHGEPTVDKNAVKKAMKAGQEIGGCILVDDYSMSIK